LILNRVSKAFESRHSWAILLFLVNIVSAVFTNLHDDEAYYWLFSKHLDWGYFDHPPMVALFIKVTTFLLGDTLIGVRLLSPISIVALWYMLTDLLKEQARDNYLWIGIAFLASPILQIYGFVTTPDVPLFLFGTAFLWALKQLLLNRKGAILLLALSMTLLAYSKYHGALVVGYALIPLIWRKVFLKVILAGAIALLLYLPHLYWQFEHAWPSFKYHLVSRHTGMEWSYVAEFILGVLLMSGALLFFKKRDLSLDQKVERQFGQSLKWVLWGFTIFFSAILLNGKIELHWLGFIALPILLLLDIQKLSASKWQRVALISQLLLVMLARVTLPVVQDNFEAFQKDEDWARDIGEKATGKPVVFMNSFQKASKFQFYTGSLAWSDNNSFYRKNQFDIWQHDTLLNDKDVYYVTKYRRGSFIEDVEGDLLGGTIVNYMALQRLSGQINSLQYEQVGGLFEGEIEFTLVNPYSYPLNFEHPQIGLEPSVYLDIGDFQDLVRIFPETGEFSMPAKSSKKFIGLFQHTNVNRDISKGEATLMLLKGPTYAQVLSSGYEVEINRRNDF